VTKSNAANERVKRRYLHFLADVKGRDEASIDAAAAAIERFEESMRRRDFKQFHIEQARAFKKDLMTARSERTGEPLSASLSTGRIEGVFHLAGPGVRLPLADKIH
jgi:hypothetical protein